MRDFITDPLLIEKKSMETIDGLLESSFPAGLNFSPGELRVVKRVIHTTADLEYAGILEFRRDPLEAVMGAFRAGLRLVTDTRMALAGINKQRLARFGVEAECFMDDEDVTREAKERGVTRALISMERAARDERNAVFVIGNAPTALMRLVKMREEGLVRPRAVIGVPVGFVGAAESKDLLADLDVPSIITRGRKGGSGVAAAIVNSILYQMEEMEA
ncbi:MAG: precorrin-8X methylmutase [Peptococcaceae bacterium]|jgi:precorrin-8X/cobalt-precorrin-8 methylmutase|nr:precorrin-8X methylmutase [Peptococcaceae bacterium]MDH7525793.1 precorrin-8X methylmutase [Peptococcaceae bacterium]